MLGWAFISSPDDSCFQPWLSAVPSQPQQNQRWNRLRHEESQKRWRVIRKFLPLSQLHVNEHRESWGWFFSLCLRASSGAGALHSAAFTGKKRSPPRLQKKLPQNRRVQVDPEDGDGWGWMGMDDGWLLQSPVAESPSDLSKHLPSFPLMHFGVDV